MARTFFKLELFAEVILEDSRELKDLWTKEASDLVHATLKQQLLLLLKDPNSKEARGYESIQEYFSDWVISNLIDLSNGGSEKLANHVEGISFLDPKELISRQTILK